MPLFTVILEFDGGTYISQFQASSAYAAARMHAEYLIGIKGMDTLANCVRLAERLSQERPVPLGGVRKVWCSSASLGGKSALVNIVATA